MRLFRLIFGAYLAFHFFDLVPYAEALFSDRGMISHVEHLPTYPIFPNLLFHFDSPAFVKVFVGVLGVLSLLFAVGRVPQTASARLNQLFKWAMRLLPVVLWYGWACLMTRNVFIRNPGMPYVGWLLLAMPFVRLDDDGTSGGVDERRPAVPPLIYNGAWVLLAVGYTISGLHKLQSPSWQDGTALTRLLDNPLSRPTIFSDAMKALPVEVMKAATWFSLGMEVLFAPLAIWKRSRPFIWVGLVGMHLGIMLVVDFVDLTLGMMMIHLFTFDQRWIPPEPSNGPRVVFFDGVCNMCNGFVNFLMQEDQHRSLMYASLQGETAAARGLSLGAAPSATIVLLDGDTAYTQSDAILRIASSLGGLWRIFTILRLVPRPLRDALYRFIAHHRYRLFGHRATCRVPTASDRAHFFI